MTNEIAIVWFRDDLRLSDNPAFAHACEYHSQVLPIYIYNHQPGDTWPVGGASRWWLEKSLVSLKQQLNRYDSNLFLFKGDELDVIKKIVSKTKAKHVLWNRRYTPTFTESDRELKTQLKTMGLNALSFHGNLLIEPWKILNQSGLPYKVFTPYWKRLKNELIISPPVISPKPENVPALPKINFDNASITDLSLYDTQVDWAINFPNYFSPGESSAQSVKDDFIDEDILGYHEQRDFPAMDATSRFSPHLHFGELSARQLWLEIWRGIELNSEKDCSHQWSFLRQLVWREFCHYLLFHFPDIDHKPFKTEFSKFSWQHNDDHLKRWQLGQTGYPLIDAGMRQLWQTGWMHNRVRMVCASFLTKHLLLHWHEGAKWFWDTLVDADLANNSCGWQWVAGSGADAAPYFRIFNPILQSKKFDPHGDYIRQWVEELKHADSKTIHAPWQANPEVLKKQGIELGASYPHIIIEHAFARQRALDAYSTLKRHSLK